MSDKENTKEVMEAAEEVTEVKEEVEVEATEEATEEVVEEATEEASEEATAQVEEETAEEVAEVKAEETEPAEESAEDEPKKKSKKGLIITIIALVVVLLGLAGAYLWVTQQYEECFLMGTYVNGTDCSGMTVDEVEALMQKQVDKYVLDVVTRGDKTEQIKGIDIGIKYSGYDQLKKEFDKQNAYYWPQALIEDNKIEAEIVYEYDSQKLDELIAGLECLKPENQVAPTNATVVCENETAVIKEETYGSQLIAEKVSEAIHAGVTSMSTSVNLDEAGCYVQPKYTKESEEVLAAQKEMNKYLSAKITYSLDGITMTIDKAQISKWVYVDENMVTGVSYVWSEEYLNGVLPSKYNTADQPGVLVSPTGKEVAIGKAIKGRRVNVDKECDQLVEDIKAGKTVTREPVLSSRGGDGYVWGTTYIEVDISAQHLWFIKNGSIALETDVITGMYGSHDTPTGVYNILEKVPGKNLRGRPLPNGKPSYITWVNYWMRVTWSGIGLHDAYWKSAFGGELYKGGGSHGCINMPPAMAKSLYGMISVGTPVIIHY